MVWIVRYFSGTSTQNVTITINKVIRLGRGRKAVLAQTMILSRGTELTFLGIGTEDNRKPCEIKSVLRAYSLLRRCVRAAVYPCPRGRDVMLQLPSIPTMLPLQGVF